MKSCNTMMRKPKRKSLKLIKKKPTVAEEFFPNLQAIGDPFFLTQCSILCTQDPQPHPQCSGVTETFIGKAMTHTHTQKGKGADFFGRFDWPAGELALQRAPPVNHLLCLHLSCSFILIPKFRFSTFFFFLSTRGFLCRDFF